MENAKLRAIAIVLKDYTAQAYESIQTVHGITSAWTLNSDDFFLPSESTVRLAEDLYQRISVKPLNLVAYIRELNLVTVSEPDGISIPLAGITIPSDGSFRF